MSANTLPDNPSDWAEMQVRGALAARAYGAEPDIVTWANRCALNPARLDPSQAVDPAVTSASARLANVAERGLRTDGRARGPVGPWAWRLSISRGLRMRAASHRQRVFNLSRMIGPRRVVHRQC